MNQQAAFWDRMAEKYFSKPVKNQSAYEAKLEQISQLLQPTSTVLEIGCGTGSTALTLAEKVARYDACDFSEAMIAIGERRAAETGIGNVRFSVKDITSEPFATDKYDLVMAHSLLHLVDGSESIINTMLDALKPGGYAVFSFVLLKSLPLPIRWILALVSITGLIPQLVFQDEQDMLKPILGNQLNVVSSWQVDNNNLFVIAQKPVE